MNFDVSALRQDDPPPQMQPGNPDELDLVDAVGSEALQNEFLRARTATLDDGLFRLEGGDAVAAAPDAEGKLQAARDALLQRAGSPRQRAMLGADLDAHLDVAREAIARHVADQTGAWDRAVRAERLGLLQDRARRDYADPGKLALYADVAAGAGADPDTARSSVWRAAIDGALHEGAHRDALDLHQQAGDRLTPDDRAALAPELAIAAQMQKGSDYVEGLLPQPMPATPAETDAVHEAALQANAQEWAHDPEQLATNRHLIDVQFGTHRRGLQQAEAARAQAVTDWLSRTDARGNPQTGRPPPSLWKQLDADQRQKVDATLAANARGVVASDVPVSDELLHEGGVQLAQADQQRPALPQRQGKPNQKAAKPEKRMSQGNASPAGQAPRPPISGPGVVETEFSRRNQIWADIVRGRPDTSTQSLLPDDWRQSLNPDYVKWTQEASAQTGVPLELLARHIWKESTYNPAKENRTAYGTYRGMGQLGSSAIKQLSLDPGAFPYFDARSSIDATAAYLALMHRQLGSWPAAVAAYNAGPGNIGDWLNGKPTTYRGPNGETKQAIAHVFRGDPTAFDR